MPWFLKLAIFVTFLFSANHFSEAKHQKKLPSAVVTGTVYCDTCFNQDFPKANHFITGASVEIQCKETGSRGGFRQKARTNNNGEFKFDLPISVSKHVNKIRGCSITLIRSNDPLCAVAASATSSSLHLKSRKGGTHIFSAGFFSFKPLKQPDICTQKSKRLSPEPNSKKQTDQLPFVPIPFLPPNPLLPPPSILPPNPFLPPPSVIPPILPTPPPSIFPPIFPTPPSPPFFHLPPIPGVVPPIPGLVPSPPPPPPPFLPIPLPPFPFQPTPGFPGVPPAEVSSESRTSSP